jgi:hypothetical protein
MQRFTFRAVLAVAVASFAATGHAQTNPPAPAAPELPKSYFPGLGEFMGRVQVDHAKLWLAGETRNWDLAAYELGELKEVFADVQDLLPRYQNIPVGEMIDAIMTSTIAQMESSIAAKDFGKFSASFDKLTEACNSCHQAANHPYIAIRRPTQSNFSNQDFLPRK